MIEVANLTKDFVSYERSPGLMGALKGLLIRKRSVKRAVDEISFSISRGEIVGLLGPNGAGKSTTVKMLTGILYPTSGTILVDNAEPYKDRINYVRKIGVVFGQRTQLWWDIPVIESLRLLQEIYNVSKSDFDNRMSRFINILALDDLLKKPVRKLSLGERMRCDLVAALIHNPTVLFLDEPTIGLDVVAKHEVRKFLKAVNQEFATTILITTHDLGDIEELCKRTIIIDHGRIIFNNTLSVLRDKFKSITRINLELSSPPAADIISSLASLPGIKLKEDGPRLQIETATSEQNIGGLLKQITNSLEIRSLQVRDADIEDIVREVYAGAIV